MNLVPTTTRIRMVAPLTGAAANDAIDQTKKHF
jgi:hypothetical protein